MNKIRSLALDDLDSFDNFLAPEGAPRVALQRYASKGGGGNGFMSILVPALAAIATGGIGAGLAPFGSATLGGALGAGLGGGLGAAVTGGDPVKSAIISAIGGGIAPNVGDIASGISGAAETAGGVAAAAPSVAAPAASEGLGYLGSGDVFGNALEGAAPAVSGASASNIGSSGAGLASDLTGSVGSVTEAAAGMPDYASAYGSADFVPSGSDFSSAYGPANYAPGADTAGFERFSGSDMPRSAETLPTSDIGSVRVDAATQTRPDWAGSDDLWGGAPSPTPETAAPPQGWQFGVKEGAALAGAGANVARAAVPPKVPSLAFNTQAAIPPLPTGPATQPDRDTFTRPDAMEAPSFLDFDPIMDDLQRRTKIATYGTSSDQSRYRDPLALDYYRNLAQRSLTDPATGMATGNPTSADYQFLQRAFGTVPRAQTTASFLSALSRA